MENAADDFEAFCHGVETHAQEQLRHSRRLQSEGVERLAALGRVLFKEEAYLDRYMEAVDSEAGSLARPEHLEKLLLALPEKDLLPVENPSVAQHIAVLRAAADLADELERRAAEWIVQGQYENLEAQVVSARLGVHGPTGVAARMLGEFKRNADHHRDDWRAGMPSDGPTPLAPWHRAALTPADPPSSTPGEEWWREEKPNVEGRNWDGLDGREEPAGLNEQPEPGRTR